MTEGGGGSMRQQRRFNAFSLRESRYTGRLFPKQQGRDDGARRPFSASQTTSDPAIAESCK